MSSKTLYRNGPVSVQISPHETRANRAHLCLVVADDRWSTTSMTTMKTSRRRAERMIGRYVEIADLLAEVLRAHPDALAPRSTQVTLTGRKPVKMYRGGDPVLAIDLRLIRNRLRDLVERTDDPVADFEQFADRLATQTAQTTERARLGRLLRERADLSVDDLLIAFETERPTEARQALARVTETTLTSDR